MTDAEVYFCRFNERAGWAMIMLHEQTGSVAIHSDYGDWLFSWPSPGRGQGSLKDFICDGSYDYLASKFENGRKERFDLEQTVKNMEDKIAEAADEKPITWHQDRCAALNEWLNDEAPSEPTLFIERMPEDLRELLGDSPWEDLVYDHEPRFYWLRDGILPALVAEIKKTIPKVEEVKS